MQHRLAEFFVARTDFLPSSEMHTATLQSKVNETRACNYSAIMNNSPLSEVVLVTYF